MERVSPRRPTPHHEKTCWLLVQSLCNTSRLHRLGTEQESTTSVQFQVRLNERGWYRVRSSADINYSIDSENLLDPCT